MLAKKLFVSDLEPGQQVGDYFAVADARQGQARNGPFWQLRLQDRTGSISGRIWSPQSQVFTTIPRETVVFVQGQVSSFRDELQIQIERMEQVHELDPATDLSLFTACSAQSPEVLLAELELLCRTTLSYRPWRRLARRVLQHPEIRTRLLTAFGGKTIHHAYVGGLLEHTLSVCRLVLAVCTVHPGLDKEILLVAALLHDLGKAWELSHGLAADYTDEGRLLGHIQITLEVLEPLLRKERELDPGLVLHLKHLIVSHHGEYEFGSPRRPKTAEAFVLHLADNLDAKLNVFSSAFDDPTAEGPAWSAFQRSMDRFLCLPVRTPQSAAEPKPRPQGQQCLLPLKG
jgi:3'-5' exoribonuclease